MIEIDVGIEAADLNDALARLWTTTGPKVKRLCRQDSADQPTPVYTVAGRYTARGWTEWTQGFLYGEAILQFDATGVRHDLGRLVLMLRHHGDLVIADWLVRPNATLRGEAPLAWLKAGGSLERVLAAAEHLPARTPPHEMLTTPRHQPRPKHTDHAWRRRVHRPSRPITST